MISSIWCVREDVRRVQTAGPENSDFSHQLHILMHFPLHGFLCDQF